MIKYQNIHCYKQTKEIKVMCINPESQILGNVKRKCLEKVTCYCSHKGKASIFVIKLDKKKLQGTIQTDWDKQELIS